MRRQDRPLTHDWIWSAIDALASRNGLTASGLARLAGLDPTAFNRSKRLTPEGRPRWPNTESIAKVLKATGTALGEFATLQLDRPLGVPLGGAGLGELSGIAIIAEIRRAVVSNWDPTPAPACASESGTLPAPAWRKFAVSVGDSSLEPVYSLGNILVVSEEAKPRAGDRVLAKPAGMPVIPCLLLTTTATHIELGKFSDTTQRLSVRQCDLDWMARIILALQ
ncbi:MAG: helix-turn-helix transcriptional regulator [Hyphomicrobiaceae bacterium]